MSSIQKLILQIDQMMIQLTKLYLDNGDLKKFQIGFDAVRMNPMFVLQNFMLHIYPHKDKIMAGDESFFLNNDYSEETNGNQDYMFKALRLKDLWKNRMNDTVKDTMKKYFKVFIVLAEQATIEKTGMNKNKMA